MSTRMKAGSPWPGIVLALSLASLSVGPASAPAQTVPTPMSDAPTEGTSSTTAVEIRRDVVYGHIDGMAMVYDVSIPAEANGAGVIFVVSGGFLSSPENQAYIQPVADPLLEAGFTVFHLRHPSTPRYLAPEIYEAVKLGRDHIFEHASELGVDPARIGVMGMSTGGLLTLLLGLDVPEELRADRGERIGAVAAYMPIVDMRDVVGQVQATPSVGFEPELASALSPIDFVSADDPPTLLIHGEADTVVPIDENSRRLLPVLEDAGVTSELVTVGAGHELFTGEDKERADRAVVEWFSTHLNPGAQSSSSPTSPSTPNTGASMSATATGPFTATLTPTTATEAFGRMTLKKEFDGDLVGTSTGEMLTWRDDSSGRASYVAVEKITGTLNGRTGSFVVTHVGHMSSDRQSLKVAVIEGSGTDELEGLSGSMVLNNVDGEHDYVFEYAFSEDQERR